MISVKLGGITVPLKTEMLQEIIHINIKSNKSILNVERNNKINV